MSRSVLAFSAVRTEGGLLPGDILQRIALEDRNLAGLTPEAYHLDGVRLRDAVNQAWTRLTVAWRSFQTALAKLPEADPATVVTRDKWILPLFNALGYGHLPKHAPFEALGKTYPISHAWHASPIHLVGCRVDIDARDKKLGSSPHGLVQDFLNRSDAHLWGFVCNGHTLRVLRDHHSLTQQAYVEFDLEAIFEGEAFSEFLLLWLTCHQSRVEAEKPEECWLEKWFNTARDEGVRALDQLRAGVEQAIAAFGTGFLRHKANRALHQALESGDLDKQDYYRQLLRLAYRLIFLFVAEDRGALLDPKAPPAARARYERWYATRRLRELAGKRRGGPHGDLWRELRLVMGKLWDGSPELGLPALGSFLWRPSSTGDLNDLELANEDLLTALRALSYVEQGKVRHAVSFRNVGAEELGSVYESLLELHPEIHKEAARFELSTAAGHERKTTGSYYTPTALVDCLLDSALEPVLDEAGKAADPEKAILDLKVRDPACGSGHFLVAAARRMALRLATVRSSGEEPSPRVVERALRDVVGKCIFGVDLNPMAVELCKVSLWMEAIEPGRPLSFLDGHIQQGNALLGATLALLEKGIPDEAFEPIEGDDRKVASALKKQNKKERGGQTSLFADFARAPESTYVRLTSAAAHVEADKDDDIAAVRKKEQDWELLTGSADYTRETFLADAWCAAFVWPKQAGAMQAAAITQDLWERMRKDAGAAPAATRKQVRELAREYAFFHWHLAFPQVFLGGGEADKQTGWRGGFDVVLGNPPWEKLNVSEQEYFARRAPGIAEARNAAARKKAIARLLEDSSDLLRSFRAAVREGDCISHFLRKSGRFPLCGRGDVNTYAVFAELMRSTITRSGRMGTIVPTGIATDEATSLFFRTIVAKKALVSLYDFRNIGFFIDVASAQGVRFCLLTIAGDEAPDGARCLFRAVSIGEIRDSDRTFVLTHEDVELLSPNTGTCPVFRCQRDAQVTKQIYRQNPVLCREDEWGAHSPWDVRLGRMLHMADDSEVFCTRNDLQERGWRLRGNVFERNTSRMVPLYEAKMVHHFDHRFGDYALVAKQSGDVRAIPQATDRLTDPYYCSHPRYWVPEQAVTKSALEEWRQSWFLGWRDITSSLDQRTTISAIIPRVACGDTFFLIYPGQAHAWAAPYLYANLCSYVFDFATRQKVGGTHLKFHVLKQLPLLGPFVYAQATRWCANRAVSAYLLPRVLELTYTAWDLEPFAKDCGYDGPPYRWDEARRFLLRCELDAAFFHLYGIARDDVDYIMETFPIVKRKDLAAHTTYRTKDTILAIYDAMARAIATGEPYQTLLDPPPADPRVAHPDRVSMPGAQ